MDKSDKPNTVDIRDFGNHPLTRTAHLSDRDFLKYILALPKDLFRRQLLGPAGRELSAKIDAAAQRIAAERKN